MRNCGGNSRCSRDESTEENDCHAQSAQTTTTDIDEAGTALEAARTAERAALDVLHEAERRIRDLQRIIAGSSVQEVRTNGRSTWTSSATGFAEEEVVAARINLPEAERAALLAHPPVMKSRAIRVAAERRLLAAVDAAAPPDSGR